MAVSFHQMKRWYLMLTGQSIWHVHQDIGKCFVQDEIRGYYNNMTEKVTRQPELLFSDSLPLLNLPSGKFTAFPVAIFQYGLGAYDLFLQTHGDKYKCKFMQCVEWAMKNQDEVGRWNNFSHYCPDHPYSAMAQGEAASLLIRAYHDTGEERYLSAAKKSIDFMLLPLEEGGTTKYENGAIYLMEYTDKSMVLNGSIFAWWGLYDFVLITDDTNKYKAVMDKTLSSLIDILPKFKNNYWSLYRLDGLIASPFYHNLHIAQMQALYQLTGEELFNDYALIWQKQQKNPLFSSIAFVHKAYQKIIEQ